MKLNDAELGMIKAVVSRFLSEKKATPRRRLVLDFQEPDLLETLVIRSLLRDINRESFLPTLLSFHFYGDDAKLLFARQSVETVLHVLKALFLQDADKTQFNESDIETQARQMGRDVSPDAIWLGLYLIDNFNVLGGYSMNADQTAMTFFRIGERIIKLKNIDSAWDELLKQRLAWLAQYEAYNQQTSLPKEVDAETFDAGPYPGDAPQSKVLVFISHSSKDAEIAFSLIELLRAALGLKDEEIRCTSVDGFRLPSGANTDQILKSEVRAARTFIGLITPNSMRSAYVMFELGARWGAELHMVPVLAGVGPEALEGPLKAINSVSADNVAQLHQLLSDLADFLGLDLQRAASYTRYATKLTHDIQRVYAAVGTNTLSQTPSVNPEPQVGERKLRSLTRDTVVEASKSFLWNRQMPKWTVLVEGKPFPVRPLAFKAAGLLPNDSATTHQAVAILKKLDFQVFYEGKPA